MAFKIVQTVENGVPKVSVVPTLWEADGIVRWPPKSIKNASKLIKDSKSRPGPEWYSYKCILKRNYIPSYDEAIKELSEMEQNTDTDYENDNCSVLRTSRHGRANDDLINFEALAQDLAQNLDNSLPSATFCQQQGAIVNVINAEDIQTMIANQATMLTKLDVVLENQKKLALKIASLSIQLEETKASICEEKERPVNVTLFNDQIRSAEENDSFYITPIENQQQLETLETNLADKIQKKKMIKSLSMLCSSSVGSGTTCAYKLLDIIFSREFLCQCSWSGGSKGAVSKIPLKNYKNFRKFFFEIVNSWDSNFTDDETEKFFKLVLRNATKRKAMKGLRQSSKRTRKSKNCENGVNRGEQLHDNASNDSEKLPAGDDDNVNNRKEPKAGDESNDNNTNEPQIGKNTEQLEAVDNELEDLC